MGSDNASIPDPAAIVRGYSDEQLREYEQFYGEQSREWSIAQDEWSRRRSRQFDPPWVRILRNLIALALVVALTIKFLA